MAKVFTYTKQPCSVERLTLEIRTSSISIALDYINLYGSNLDIFFKADLTNEDVIILDALVINHSGIPTPEEENKTTVIARQFSSFNPSPQSIEIGKAAITVDGDSKVITRGQTYTDEGSFRDSFSGTSLFTELDGTYWFSSASDEIVGNADLSTIKMLYPYIKLKTDADSCFTQGSVCTDTRFSLEENYKGNSDSGVAVVSNWFPDKINGGEITVSNSKVHLTTSTVSGSCASIFKQIDYLPIKLQCKSSITQRINNQKAIIGLADISKTVQSLVVFTGSDETKVNFVTSIDGGGVETQTTECSIPYGKKTSGEHIYTIEAVNGACSLLIDDILVATHKDFIPDAYDTVGIWLDICNTDAASSATTLSSHWVAFQNVNQVDIINSFSTVPVKTKLTSPSTLDGKPLFSMTARPVGLFTYISSSGDNQADPSQIDNGDRIKLKHVIGDSVTQDLYFDINAIDNETHLHTAVMQWKNAEFDEVECEIHPKLTSVTNGTGTNYTVVNGILVATPPGYGNKVVDWDNVNLVEMVVNEYGIKPPGYWDADYNTTTKTFENITFNQEGTGRFNIFIDDVELNCFVPCFVMIGDGIYEIKSNDVSQIGHNMRIKITLTTIGADHNWWFCAAINLFRQKTC